MKLLAKRLSILSHQMENSLKYEHFAHELFQIRRLLNFSLPYFSVANYACNFASNCGQRYADGIHSHISTTNTKHHRSAVDGHKHGLVVWYARRTA